MKEAGDRRSATDGWTILRAGADDSGGLGIPTKLSGIDAPDGPIRLALGAKGEPRLLMPLGKREKPSLVTGAPALDVRVSEYSDRGRATRFLDLSCLVQELETVFGEVAEQILLRVQGGMPCVEAARSTIEEFRSLLIRSPEAVVSREKIAGLVGELLVLKRLLDRSPEAWRSWNGPASDRHDFSKEANALEVKVTTKKGKTEITVNGLEQLSEPAGGLLYLQHFELEAAATGMLSVSSLGRAVLASASQPGKIRELLAAIGCNDVDDESWNAAAFRLERESLYEVREGFPRVVPSLFAGGSAPAGVSGLTYVTDLAVAAHFLLPPENIGAIEELFLP